MTDAVAVVASLARRPSASYSSSSSTSPSLRRYDTEAPTPGPKPHEDHPVGTFGHLTNEALIGMVYHLDDVNYHQHVGQGNMGPHPQLERVMQSWN